VEKPKKGPSIKQIAHLVQVAKLTYGSTSFFCTTQTIEKHTILSPPEVLTSAIKLLEVLDLRKSLGKKALRHVIDELLTPVERFAYMSEAKIPEMFLTTEEMETTYRQYGYFRQNINILELGTWINNPLQDAGIKLVGELVQHREQDLLRIKQIGRESVRKIKLALHELGLYIGMTLQDGVVFVQIPLPVAPPDPTQK